MNPEFEAVGWEQAAAKAAGMNEEIKNAVAAEILEVSQMVQNLIQGDMPVDTGWAQSRWGEPDYGGIWEESDDGWEIKQGSSIEPYEYIIALNEGSSSQAPAGFIDSAAAWGQEQAVIGIEQKLSVIDD